jgi:hypothetical protein
MEELVPRLFGSGNELAFRPSCTREIACVDAVLTVVELHPKAITMDAIKQNSSRSKQRDSRLVATVIRAIASNEQWLCHERLLALEKA